MLLEKSGISTRDTATSKFLGFFFDFLVPCVSLSEAGPKYRTTSS